MEGEMKKRKEREMEDKTINAIIKAINLMIKWRMGLKTRKARGEEKGKWEVNERREKRKKRGTKKKEKKVNRNGGNIIAVLIQRPRKEITKTTRKNR